MTVESTPGEDLRMDIGALMGALRARALRIGIVTALLLVVTFVALLFVPKLYESSASLLIEDRSSAYTEAAGAQSQSSGGGVSIDALISSQIELIKSRDTLLAVVDALALKSVPEFSGGGTNPLTMFLSLIGKKPQPKGDDEVALQTLSDRLTVIRERDSAVITILVRASDPQLAAKIANAIAAEHIKRRTGQSLSDTAEATAWLQQQIAQLRVKVEQADTTVADYKAKNGIFAGSNGTTLADQQISDIGKQLTDAQGVLNSARQHAELIRSLLSSGQPVDGVDDVRNSAVVQSLIQSRATLQSTLAEKLATLLPAHPTIKALSAQIAQVNKQITAEAKHIADGLDAQVKVETGVIASLNDDLRRAQLAASTQTQDSVTLDSLTREAKAQRDLLDAYLLKYRDAAGRTDAGSVLPDVRVVTQAAPSMVPASPKTTLTLGAVAFVSLVLQIGMVLFGELMSGRAVFDRAAVLRDQEPDEEPVAREIESIAGIPREHESEPEPEPMLDLADMPEPELAHADEPREPEGPAPVLAGGMALSPTLAPSSSPAPRHHVVAAAEIEFSNLGADISLGRVRVVLLAGVTDARDAAVVADILVEDALRKGLSVCRVDAGSGRATHQPGLTDLCADRASYGDIVHKVREGLAEVPWGQLPALDHRSMRPLTLLEALADIYEVVIITTGRAGLNSSLPLFAGAGGRVVMVRRPGAPGTLVEALSADAGALGFEIVQSVAVPERETAVA